MKTQPARTAFPIAMPAIAALALSCLLPFSATAQVYKCKDTSGATVYAEHPCGDGAQQLNLRNDPPQPTAATDEAGASGDSQDATGNIESNADHNAERECFATVTASIKGPSDDRVATYRQQMTMLDMELAKTTDAQSAQTLRARMERLRQAINSENIYVYDRINEARQRCRAQNHAGQE